VRPCAYIQGFIHLNYFFEISWRLGNASSANREVIPLATH
jgi:hypothetical protein